MDTALISAGVALIVAGLGFWAQRLTRETQETDVFTDAAVKLVAPLTERIATLEVEVARLKRHLDTSEKERLQLMQWATSMHSQLVNARLDPKPFEDFI